MCTACATGWARSAELMLDPACVFDSLNDAIRVGRACAEAAFRWYEDPVRPTDLGAFRHRTLREAIGILVLQTEHVPGPEAKADFLLAGGRTCCALTATTIWASPAA